MGIIANNVAIDAEDGTIEITVQGTDGVGADDSVATPCNTDGANQATTDSINIEGVLVSLVGSGATSVTVTVRGTGDVRLPGGANSTATVIAAVVDPLTDDNVKVGQTLELIRHTGKPSGGSEFHLVITEAHKDSFDGGQLELKFSGLPEDVTVTDLDAWVTTKKDLTLILRRPLPGESSTRQYRPNVKGGARCGQRRRGDRAPTDGA